MRRDSIRLSRRHQVWFYGTFAALFLSGACWLVVHYLVPKSEHEVTRPAEPWSMKIHGACAMASLIMLGTFLPGHVRRAWSARRNQPSGIGFLCWNGVLVLSGYALYYLGGEETRSWASATHWIFGLGFPLVLAYHIWRGRKSRPAQKPPR